MKAPGKKPMSAAGDRGFGSGSRVEALLRSADFEEQLNRLLESGPRKIISRLLSCLYSPDEELKWRAVTAVGMTAARIADADMEAGRVVMRRLIWSLNDESGGIGWGAPEAMGEIMARHAGLADEYFRILVSYIDADGNPLENVWLERGVLWGIGRLAQVRPHLMKDCARQLASRLDSEDAVHRGFAAWALGFLDSSAYTDRLSCLLEDRSSVLLFENGCLTRLQVSDLAARALQSK